MFKITFTNIHGIVMNDYIINLRAEFLNYEDYDNAYDKYGDPETVTVVMRIIEDKISNNKNLIFIDEQDNIVSIPSKYFQNYVCKIRKW